ncbi:histone deacetylase family protein [Chitinimonas sp. BJYL2]|uniref:histone deacetylase family protein n=1 Tax=Chitinimonas sp. BJYL2 TaxID=2976696 RepID=UPI0027E4D212|nr:histone deacetylase family protein [Chitinimonas sp. BJYL2]
MLSWLARKIAGSRPTAYLTHPDCALHDMGSHHPECPARLAAIQDQLIASGLWDHLWHVEPPLVTHEQLALVHPPRYVEALEQLSPAEGIVHLDPDTAINRHSLRAAQRAAGAVVRATELVVNREAANAFCAVRPPGHHAESKRAMGFCLFNNLGVGVAQALKMGIERVAVADFDVHHGNGTEELFHDNPRVMMVSIFQSPFYPYSGENALGPNMHNVPLKAGSRGDALREAVTTQWLPALNDFKPGMIFISAGFDAHRDDEMASMGLVEDDYAWITEQLMEVAANHAEGRIVSVLEGGYDLSALGRSAAAHVRVLAGLQ